jgi:hypothetical protein
MPLSRDVIATLVDLIENKLAVMHIESRDDLREVVVLQHCLGELRCLGPDEITIPLTLNDLPRRGRRRKISAIMEDLRDDMQRQRA